MHYKKERDQAIKKLKENRTKLQNKIKEHELFKKKQEIKEQKKLYEYEVKLNMWGYPETEKRKNSKEK